MFVGTQLAFAQVPVEEWRTRLWEEALAEAADLRDWPLAARLQRCFTETRLDRFQLEPGVKVGLGLVAECRLGLLVLACGASAAIHKVTRVVITYIRMLLLCGTAAFASCWALSARVQLINSGQHHFEP